MYYEHQVQRADGYEGPLDDLSIEEVRSLFPEMLDYTGATYWLEFPLPPAGLPGLLHATYERDEPAGELIQIGLGYIDAIARNERKSMHNRWREAREFIAAIERRVRMETQRDEVLRQMADNEARGVAPQLVYFIGAASGPIKIGIAANPRDRLKGLQTSHHERLELLATCDGGMEREKAYHRQFKALRLNGEWFERCPEIEAEIERLNNLQPIPERY